ncbi:alkaline phosphatase, tissue-nonspecific isozyme-like isoform X2 [Ostrea edulis]|nr:alkaline phosphatase, tissue-nonspecific isozyme-like isoform X2 [Ostrea edulis]XP_048776562.2 alkaline phosphatase, tissue-nonspecific isozyme-like isoform X2 [Ostrea edulis]
MAQENLKKNLQKQWNTNIAKNVILFLGDGMGIPTITAARIYKGQQQNETGEESKLVFEEFSELGLIKTYTTDEQVPDSAGTATAFLCGVKTKSGVLGMDDRADYKNCTSSTGAEVDSILRMSKQKGKSVGIVTTARLTHATPAAAYCHSASRSWEGSYNLIQDMVDPLCTDIAYQLVMNNSDIDVLMGGGRRFFLSTNKTDPELNYTSYYQRPDMDLVDEWIRQKQADNASHSYVWNNAGFNAIDPKVTDYVLGLFESSHMQYEYQREKGPSGEPSLAEMTKKAIEILQKNDKGYFLLVEGGRIDHGHHATQAAAALLETVMFDSAVQVAKEMTDTDDTLLVVTADHSHAFMIAGYPSRGNDILGTVDEEVGEDDMPYTTLTYGNGPQQRRNLTGIDTTAFTFRQSGVVPKSSETHAGEDVPVYAQGPMAHLFVGTHEQNYIAHVLAYASCVGPYPGRCDSPLSSVTESSASSVIIPSLLLSISLFLSLL